MRTTRDRLRHAISFEIIGLMIVTPLGAWGYGVPMADIGVVTVVSATIATAWNYVYNLLFDHVLMWLRGDPRKSVPMRLLHTLLFEAGLLTVLMPFIAWYLGVGWLEAMVMDMSFSLFYLVYAFAFNWAYDVVFPVPIAGRHERVRMPKP